MTNAGYAKTLKGSNKIIEFTHSPSNSHYFSPGNNIFVRSYYNSSSSPFECRFTAFVLDTSEIYNVSLKACSPQFTTMQVLSISQVSKGQFDAII
mmetsp:Transcript_23000/g.19965  ORF Transcript_23000/g.19965 Transcript_23000/m.19965 type:complete len:95 (-) Transcript_23000:663-947(-)